MKYKTNERNAPMDLNPTNRRKSRRTSRGNKQRKIRGNKQRKQAKNTGRKSAHKAHRKYKQRNYDMLHNRVEFFIHALLSQFFVVCYKYSFKCNK